MGEVPLHASIVSSPEVRPSCHLQPEVNYFDVLEKGDFPCILHSES